MHDSENRVYSISKSFGMTVPKRFRRYGVKYAILQEQEVD
jgi:hypothetical protein